MCVNVKSNKDFLLSVMLDRKVFESEAKSPLNQLQIFDNTYRKIHFVVAFIDPVLLRLYTVLKLKIVYFTVDLGELSLNKFHIW